ncbi:hypothetical protein ACFFX0_00870 [Citricoccus parietis]|uniref:Uncharacterized protein n=1 Tax=Citricoccus parietis TaxID=592307 RepID=A0ABV5FT19_9MICC
MRCPIAPPRVAAPRSSARKPSPTTNMVVCALTRLPVRAPHAAARFLASCLGMPRLPVNTTVCPYSG